MLGPGVGSFLSGIGGYSSPFYALGTIESGLTLAALIIIPNTVTQTTNQNTEKVSALFHGAM